MKTMLITAAALGAVIAGLVVWFSNENHPHERLADGVLSTVDKFNSDAPHLERGAHAMG